jgi:type I restriction enzyme S subunit
MMFYKETNFKETPIGKVPKDWIIEKLGALCKFKRGFSYRSSQITPSRTQIRFLTINDIEKEGGLKREAEKLYIREDVEIDPEFFVNEGDVFIANTDMAKGFIIGAPILMKNIDEKYVYSMDLTKLIFNKAEVDSGFLFYYLTHSSMRRRMKAAAQGTNVLHLNHVIIRNFFIPLPPFPEQQKIAEILSTVDEAIQKTNEIIAKTERLKKGLMQELLTKGIGHKEFKDTEIGRIPKEWEVVELENVVEIWDKYRVPVKEQDRKPGPFPYCGANGIIDYVAGYTHDGEFVLLAEDGGFFGPFENSAYIMRGKFWANNHVHILKAIEGILINEFLMYCLNFMDLTPFLTGSTRPKLTQKDMREIPLPLPPIQEQQKIAEILSAVDKKLEIERKEKARLEKIKQGLMDLLLTGKIRVRVS